MKAFIGFLQLAFGIGGIVALVNGQWAAMIGAWIAAILIGFIGNFLVRAVEGVSQSGQEAASGVGQAMSLLRAGSYTAALGVTRSTVSSFRLGGDTALLGIALTIHSVALGATGDIQGARNALNEASTKINHLPAEMATEAEVFRRVQRMIRRELDDDVPDPEGFVSRFLELTDES